MVTRMVSSEEIETTLDIVAETPAPGARISSTVAKLAAQSRISPKRARFVVRAALDRGHLRTDRFFRLHLRDTPG